MQFDTSVLRQFAQITKRSDTQSPGVAPRTPMSTVILSTVNTVNPYQTELSLITGSGLVIPGLRYLHHFSADDPPRPGDMVAVQIVGSSAFAIGRHPRVNEVDPVIMP